MNCVRAACLFAVLVGAFIVLHAISPERPAVIQEQQQQEQEQQQQQTEAAAPGAEVEEEQEEWHFRQMEAGSLQGEPKCPPKPQDAKSHQPKTRWPELVGKTADAAKAVVQQEAGAGYRIQVIGPDSFATMDWRCDRIRIWLNKQQLVSQPPMIG